MNPVHDYALSILAVDGSFRMIGSTDLKQIVRFLHQFDHEGSQIYLAGQSKDGAVVLTDLKDEAVYQYLKEVAP